MSDLQGVSPEVQKRNFRNVQIDAIGVSIASVAAPFLPVFLTRLGASNFQVGLLSSMPGVTGLVLAILVGRFLQSRRRIVPWFSLARLLYLSSYTLTGILALLLPKSLMVSSTLVIWAIATLPQTALAVSFSVVMNAVAGPEGRYTLLSRRWAIFGLTSVVGTFIITRLIDRVAFPLNYALMFLGLSAGGLLSYYFSNRIRLPEQVPPALTRGFSLKATWRAYGSLLRDNPAFLSFTTKRFVYFSALALSAPVMPLFLVHEIGASDSQIGSVNMTFSLVMLVGYFLWPAVSKRRGGRFVLLATTLGMVLYPALTASTHDIHSIMLFAGIAGLFQAGLDLVFFDELLKTVPAAYSAIFISMAQSMQYLSTIIAPLVGSWLANSIGFGGALLVSAGLRLLGFLLFLRVEKTKPPA
jgi:hypothetical protein